MKEETKKKVFAVLGCYPAIVFMVIPTLIAGCIIWLSDAACYYMFEKDVFYRNVFKEEFG